MNCVRNHLVETSTTTLLPLPNTTTAQPQANHLLLQNLPPNLDPEDMSRWLQSVNINRLEELLKTNKQKIDSMDERGHTLLHLAILANRIEIVRLLISLGANVTLANRDGWSPLHIAAYSGNSDIINFLLQNKL